MLYNTNDQKKFDIYYSRFLGIQYYRPSLDFFNGARQEIEKIPKLKAEELNRLMRISSGSN